jgi:hypothetical protein
MKVARRPRRTFADRKARTVPSAISLASAAIWVRSAALAGLAGCVPPGNAESQDAGPTAAARSASPRPNASAPPPAPPVDVLRTPFEDDFEHGLASSASGEGGALVEPDAEWVSTQPGIWHLESGRLCGEHARNHGIWLKRAIPVNARIEFDAVSMSADGDLKAEYWGDGRSFATALSYTNATSYLTIYGGWHNKFHVLARLNEHGADRQEVTVDPNSDDPREKQVNVGQVYRFKVERTDGHTVRWWVDGNEMLTFADTAPLVGPGHDHFGFNDWDVKLCFDNVRVVPLP